MILFVVAKFELELPLNHQMCHKKLRQLFVQNKDVTDIRSIDLLVIRVSYFVKTALTHILLVRKAFLPCNVVLEWYMLSLCIHLSMCHELTGQIQLFFVMEDILHFFNGISGISKNKDTSPWNFVHYFGLVKFCYSRSVILSTKHVEGRACLPDIMRIVSCAFLVLIEC